MDIFTKKMVQLSRVKGMGDKRMQYVLKYTIPGDIDSLYAAVEECFPEAYVDFRSLGDKSTDIDLLNANEIQVIGVWDELYPSLLREIVDPPTILYVLGDTKALSNELQLAVVGTRKVSAYGKRWTNRIIEQAREMHVSIISGLAFGVDATAHQAALDHGLATCAVIPGGVEKATPTAHQKMYDAIIENGGCVVSEDLPGTKITPGMFASRNRIIAGLSHGVLVIEAAEKSGSLITARLALEYDREVFAIPGSLDMQQSKGTNRLLQAGSAKLVMGFEDIAQEFSLFTHTVAHVAREQNLSPLQASIYEVIIQGPKFLDDLDGMLDASAQDISNACVQLELVSCIGKDQGGRYFAK